MDRTLTWRNNEVSMFYWARLCGTKNPFSVPNEPPNILQQRGDFELADKHMIDTNTEIRIGIYGFSTANDDNDRIGSDRTKELNLSYGVVWGRIDA
jgi:hypothetical protein